VHDALAAAGINPKDAEAFAAYEFERQAVVRDQEPSHLVTPAQRARLSWRYCK